MSKTDDIQKLREITGAGVMESKNALADAQGDLEKALEILKEKGMAKALKKASRPLGAGIIDAYVHNDRVGVLVRVSCETDFVARSEPFRELVHNIAMQIAAMNPENITELQEQAYIKDEKTTVGELVQGAIAKLGENIKIEEFTRYEI